MNSNIVIPTLCRLKPLITLLSLQITKFLVASQVVFYQIRSHVEVNYQELKFQHHQQAPGLRKPKSTLLLDIQLTFVTNASLEYKILSRKSLK